MLTGAWVLIDIKGNESEFFTQRSFDVYKDKRTGKEYRKGPWKVFRDKLPELIDKNSNFEFIQLINGKAMTTEECAREIMATQILK